MEVLYCVFDIMVLDGHTITHLPLAERHTKLQHALRCKRDSVPLEGGRTVITGRVVPILPDQQEGPIPGYARSAMWSVKGHTIQHIVVRPPPSGSRIDREVLSIRDYFLGLG